VRRLRERLVRDDGLSLPEILITTLLMSIAGAIFSTVLFSVQESIATQQERSDNNDAARLAVERLDREIRSGNVLYNPAAEFDPYYSLRVYTQSNQVARCVQWRVHERTLQRRSWPAGSTEADLIASPPAWTIVAERIVNRDRSVQPFTLDPDPSKSGRTVIVEILAADPGGSSSPSRVKASITGRNTTFNYPSASCAATPPA
jgi:Tfp pilus assembly protein PilV